MIDLKVLDGFIEGDKFILRGILGHAVYFVHNAENLRSMGRLIDSKGEAFVIRIDKDKTVLINKEQSLQLQKEYFLVADRLEK